MGLIKEHGYDYEQHIVTVMSVKMTTACQRVSCVNIACVAGLTCADKEQFIRAVSHDYHSYCALLLTWKCRTVIDFQVRGCGQ